MPTSSAKHGQIRGLIILIAALQAVCVLDFMLVLPLGPELAQGLGFSSHQVAWLTTAYAVASLLAGGFAVPYLDRFDRKKALLTALCGLALGILLASQAENLQQLLLARGIAGFFSAPAVATGMAILIDQTPPQQRGTAIAKAMIGFSVASIAGIPLALELSARFGWAWAFKTQAILVMGVALSCCYCLPALHAHRALQNTKISPWSMLQRPVVRKAAALQGISQFSAFLIIPNFSAFYLLNLNFPREDLGWLYLGGGLCALLAMQLTGRLCDGIGVTKPIGMASAAFSLGLLPFFGITVLPLELCFLLFMSGNAARAVCLTTVFSHIPEPAERAGFMALQKMLQDLGIALATGCAVWILGEQAGQLTHSGFLAGVAFLGACVALVLLSKLRDVQPKP